VPSLPGIFPFTKKTSSRWKIKGISSLSPGRGGGGRTKCPGPGVANWSHFLIAMQIPRSWARKGSGGAPAPRRFCGVGVQPRFHRNNQKLETLPRRGPRSPSWSPRSPRWERGGTGGTQLGPMNRARHCPSGRNGGGSAGCGTGGGPGGHSPGVGGTRGPACRAPAFGVGLHVFICLFRF